MSADSLCESALKRTSYSLLANQLAGNSPGPRKLETGGTNHCSWFLLWQEDANGTPRDQRQ